MVTDREIIANHYGRSPADAINVGFVLGNKVMVRTVNAGRRHFEAGVHDLASCEIHYPGWLARLLTHRVHGLQNCQEVAALSQARRCSGIERS